MAGGEMVSESFDSKVLKGNPLGDPTKRDITIYLPPKYDPNRRYPAAYAIVGYTGTGKSLLAPLHRSAGGGSEGQVGSAHPHGKDGADGRPDGRLLHEGRRESVHQLDRGGPLRRLPSKGNRALRRVEVSDFTARDLG